MKPRLAPKNTRAVITIEGACARPTAFTHHDLSSAHEDYQVADVSKVDARLVGTAVRLRTLIDHVGPDFHARYMTVGSEDGSFSACLPLEDTTRTALVVYEIKGKPLERDQGGPARFIIPFFADKCANVKGATRIVLSEEAGEDNRPSTADEHEAIHARDGNTGDRG
jgi:DMSO/TMAO reductase YedYZ molybdopterin-dependent catalytic subunit